MRRLLILSDTESTLMAVPPLTVSHSIIVQMQRWKKLHEQQLERQHKVHAAERTRVAELQRKEQQVLLEQVRKNAVKFGPAFGPSQAQYIKKVAFLLRFVVFRRVKE